MNTSQNTNLSSAYNAYMKSIKDLESALDAFYNGLKLNHQPKNRANVESILDNLSRRNHLSSKKVAEKILLIQKEMKRTSSKTKFSSLNLKPSLPNFDFEVNLKKLRAVFEADKVHPKISKFLNIFLENSAGISKDLLKKNEAGKFMVNIKNNCPNPKFKQLAEDVINLWKKEIKNPKPVTNSLSKQTSFQKDLSQANEIKKKPSSLLNGQKKAKIDSSLIRKKTQVVKPKKNEKPLIQKPAKKHVPSKFEKIAPSSRKKRPLSSTAHSEGPAQRNAEIPRNKKKKRYDYESDEYYDDRYISDDEEWFRRKRKAWRDSYHQTRKEENYSKKMARREELELSDASSIGG
eukprot:augustus_masked-scaffold_10-processed-gene-11.52-mRNA-1 protein AED:1.00 eAED:1.00 QI:0/-1/0/0/-1/1/1/0/347